MTLPDLPSLDSCRSSLDKLKGFRDSVERRLESAKGEISSLKEEGQALELVANLFRTMADQEIVNSTSALEALQTEGLSAIFDDQTISTRTEVGLSRGKVSLDLITSQVKHGELIEGKSMESFGESVTTAQSLLLRIFVMTKRGLRPFLMFDESLKTFNPKYSENMGEFLCTLCEKLGLDILMVTHNIPLFDCAHKGYKIRQSPEGAKFDLVHQHEKRRQDST